MRKLRFVSIVILLALLALLGGGCGSSAPQQTQEFEAQPTQQTSRLAGGEAIGIVQTWLGQRTYSYTDCTIPTFRGPLAPRSRTPTRPIGAPCPDEAKQQRAGNCLDYVTTRRYSWTESFQGDGVSLVKLTSGYVWEVYEQSQSVRTVETPPSSPFSPRPPCQ